MIMFVLLSVIYISNIIVKIINSFFQFKNDGCNKYNVVLVCKVTDIVI